MKKVLVLSLTFLVGVGFAIFLGANEAHAFAVGDRVKVASSQAPVYSGTSFDGASFLSEQYKDSGGIVLEKGFRNTSYPILKIDFDSGVDGWVDESSVVLESSTPLADANVFISPASGEQWQAGEVHEVVLSIGDFYDDFYCQAYVKPFGVDSLTLIKSSGCGGLKYTDGRRGFRWLVPLSFDGSYQLVLTAGASLPIADPVTGDVHQEWVSRYYESEVFRVRAADVLFAVENRIAISPASGADVRGGSTPGQQVIGHQSLDSLGTIKRGPELGILYDDFYTPTGETLSNVSFVWWWVDFDEGADGWVMENSLKQVKSVPILQGGGSNVIDIVSPKLGDVWEVGESYQIEWVVSPPAYFIDVYLPDISDQPIISRAAGAGGSYNWTIPATFNGLSLAGTNRRITIYDSSGNGRYGISDAFSITATGDTGGGGGEVNHSPAISNFSGPTSLNAGQAGTWTVSASDPDGDTLTYQINWGDGSALSQGQSASFYHAYNTPGTYTITVTVSDGKGGSVQRSVSVTINSSGGQGGSLPVMGERVMVNDNVRVRSLPNGTLKGVQYETSYSGSRQIEPARGVVVAGPEVAGGYTWVKVDYDYGPDGWSAADFLDPIGSPTRVWGFNSEGILSRELVSRQGGRFLEPYYYYVQDLQVSIPSNLAQASLTPEAAAVRANSSGAWGCEAGPYGYLNGGRGYKCSYKGESLSGGSGTGTSGPATSSQIPGSAFTIGDRVATTAFLNVRSAASTNSSILGVQPIGARGNIIEGPVEASGYTWWKINYDAGVDGWSAQDWFKKIEQTGGTTNPGGGEVSGPFEVTAPVAGDVWKVGEDRRITWNPPAGTSVVDIELVGAGIIFREHPNSGLAAWLIPFQVNGVSTVGAEKYILVREPTGSYKLSGAFSIQESSLNIGDNVMVVRSGAQVRLSVAEGHIPVTTRYFGDRGRIVGGPEVVGGARYWNVDFDTGVDGWMSEGDVVKPIAVNFASNPPSLEPIIGPTSTSAGANTLWRVRAIDPEGGEIRYDVQWDDGSSNSYTGASGEEVVISHAYSTIGSFNFRVVARDLEGGSDSESLSVLVSDTPFNQSPTVYSLTGFGVVAVGVNNSWEVRARDPEGAGLNYVVAWGDGSTTNYSGASDQPVTITHTYNQVGSYVISVTASDGNSTGIKTLAVTVNLSGANNKPVVDSFTGPSSVVIHSTGNWVLSGSDRDGDSLSYTVDWGDGQTSSYVGASGREVGVSHVYRELGDYAVTVSASDGKETAVRNVTVVSVVNAAAGCSTKFGAGDKVVTTDQVNVRNQAGLNGSVLFTSEIGFPAEIVAVSVAADNYCWWNIGYTRAGVYSLGWVVEDFITFDVGAPAGGEVWKFSYGDRVRATDNIVARNGAGLAYANNGIVPAGSEGIIVIKDGPVAADGYKWWKISWREPNLNTLVTGFWSVENWLELVTPVADGLIDSSSFASPTQVTAGDNNWWQVFGRDPSSHKIRFEVNWGDGQTGTYTVRSGVRDDGQSKAYHVYSTPGNYTIRIRAFGSQGETQDKTLAIQVFDGPPPSSGLVTLPVPVGPELIGAGTEGTWMLYGFDHSAGEGVQSLTYNVDWGDGTFDVYSGLSRYDPISAKHTYAQAGFYTINVELTNLVGAKTSNAAEVEVYDPTVAVQFKRASEVWVVAESAEIRAITKDTLAPYTERLTNQVLGYKKRGSAGVILEDRVEYGSGKAWMLIQFFGAEKAWVDVSALGAYGFGMPTVSSGGRFGINEVVEIAPIRQIISRSQVPVGRGVFEVKADPSAINSITYGQLADGATGGSRGIVIGGPVVVNGQEWWKVRWNSGLEGWSDTRHLMSQNSFPKLLRGWGLPLVESRSTTTVWSVPGGAFLGEHSQGTKGLLKDAIFNYDDESWWWYMDWAGEWGTGSPPWAGWVKESELVGKVNLYAPGFIGNPGGILESLEDTQNKFSAGMTVAIRRPLDPIYKPINDFLGSKVYLVFPMGTIPYPRSGKVLGGPVFFLNSWWWNVDLGGTDRWFSGVFLGSQ